MDWLDHLKYMKQKSGLTTREIAEQSGLPEPTLEKLFSGQTKDPKLTTIRTIVHFFGCTLDDLVPLDSKKSPAPVQAETEEMIVDEKRLLSNYHTLNREGRQKLISYSDDLISCGHYATQAEDVG